MDSGNPGDAALLWVLCRDGKAERGPYWGAFITPVRCAHEEACVTVELRNCSSLVLAKLTPRLVSETMLTQTDPPLCINANHRLVEAQPSERTCPGLGGVLGFTSSTEKKKRMKERGGGGH